MKTFGWGDALNKKSGLTLPYVKLVMQWLAKFHALSYVHTRKGNGNFEDWQEKNPWSFTFAQKPPEEFAAFHENMIGKGAIRVLVHTSHNEFLKLCSIYHGATKKV